MTSAAVLFSCGRLNGNCSTKVPSGTNIRLTATPAGGNTFFRYDSNNGSTSGCTNNPVCNFTLTHDSITTAKWHTTLSVTVGSGKGTVFVKHASTGVTIYEVREGESTTGVSLIVGTVIRLEAIVRAGFGLKFGGFDPTTGSADLCTGFGGFQGIPGVCAFLLDEPSIVVAKFVPV